MRTWHFKNGQVLEAEYVKTVMDKYRLIDADGKEYTLPIEAFDLSDEDREYLELENPPKLEIEFRKSVQRISFTKVRGSEDRPPEQRAKFGVLIKQTGSGDYPYPLTAEVFAVGQEIKGDRYILLDRFYSSFTLTGYRSEFEFHSKRIIRMTDMWGTPTGNTGLILFSRRGEQYYGFVIVVKDKRGKIIAADASNDWMLDHLDMLEERGLGNYMDRTFQRTYPSRPSSNYGDIGTLMDRY